MVVFSFSGIQDPRGESTAARYFSQAWRLIKVHGAVLQQVGGGLEHSLNSSQYFGKKLSSFTRKDSIVNAGSGQEM